MDHADYLMGVDLGGTKVEACLIDRERHLYRRARRPVEASLGIERVIENIHQVIDEARDGKPYSAIGLGTPGTYLPGSDTIYGAPHTPVYETPGFITEIRNSFQVPLWVENDANCLALAEYVASCEGKYSHVMAVIMGTGFGSGLIINRRLFRGAHGGAGEIGHTTIDYNGRLCECGRRGCVEAYLSGPSLSRRYAESTGTLIPLPDIYQRYLCHEPEAIDLFNESFSLLANVFANVVNLFDLEAIIMGGGVSNIAEWYTQVPGLMKKGFFGIPRPVIPLIQAKLGDSAGVLGAAYLPLQHY